MLKFNLHNVVNIENGEKARITYNLDNRVDEKRCVTIRCKCILENLSPVISQEADNDSDGREDYYESDSFVFFEDHPQYPQARAAAERALNHRSSK